MQRFSLSVDLTVGKGDGSVYIMQSFHFKFYSQSFAAHIVHLFIVVNNVEKYCLACSQV